MGRFLYRALRLQPAVYEVHGVGPFKNQDAQKA